MEKSCSIIICTRNRAEMLVKTLNAFQKVEIPADLWAELIVVDNGSEDRTGEVIRQAKNERMEIRHLIEPMPGKSRALNAALAVAKGEVLLFTDDDVEPAVNWIETMTRPLIEDRCDAVAGRIILTEELQRAWFTPMHRTWLAWIFALSPDSPELVGANMAIRKSAFEWIGPFDEELGPGASGFGEDHLIWLQMKQAGMSILPAEDSVVTHHPEESRLLRSSWLATARSFGRTDAYMKYHWEHSTHRYSRIKSLVAWCKLVVRRAVESRKAEDSEGCPAWEMSYLVRLESIKQFQIESCRPKNYERHGLRKIAGR
jgi:glycosyltransferase involved in cell wall biosynthesis